jgi:hypothetical protein
MEGIPCWRLARVDRAACRWRTRSSTAFCAFGLSGSHSEGLKAIVCAPSTLTVSEGACNRFGRRAVNILAVEWSVRLLLRGDRW